MAVEMKVKFWGVRGATPPPAALHDTLNGIIAL